MIAKLDRGHDSTATARNGQRSASADHGAGRDEQPRVPDQLSFGMPVQVVATTVDTEIHRRMARRACEVARRHTAALTVWRHAVLRQRRIGRVGDAAPTGWRMRRDPRQGVGIASRSRRATTSRTPSGAGRWASRDSGPMPMACLHRR